MLREWWGYQGYSRNEHISTSKLKTGILFGIGLYLSELSHEDGYYCNQVRISCRLSLYPLETPLEREENSEFNIGRAIKCYPGESWVYCLQTEESCLLGCSLASTLKGSLPGFPHGQKEVHFEANRLFPRTPSLSYHLPSADSPEGTMLSHRKNSMVAKATPWIDFPCSAPLCPPIIFSLSTRYSLL